MLDSGRANGKISETAYLGRLDALAKDLRSRYPGYREYIDTEIQKVTGVNPANAYLKSLLGDINSFVNAGKEEWNKVRNEVVKAGDAGITDRTGQVDAAQMLRMLDQWRGQGVDPNEALARVQSWAGPANILNRRLEEKERERTYAKGEREEVSRIAEDEANLAAQGTVFNHFNLLHATAGAPTAAQIQDAVLKAQQGVPGAELNDQQAETFGRSLMAGKARASLELDDYFAKLGPDGRPLSSILGAAKIAEIKNNQLSKFDTVKDAIYAKDYGAATRAMATIRAMGSDDAVSLLRNKDLGPTFRMSNAMEQLKFDPASKQFFMGQLATGFPAKFDEFVKQGGLRMATQSSPDTPAGVTETLKKQVEDLRTGVKGANNPTIAKTYDALLGAVETIASPKMTDLNLKSNLAKAAFDPSNLGLLTMLGEDKYENGVYKMGKFSWFNRLYDEQMTKTVKSLGGDNWDQYKNLAKQMWGRELFGPFLKQMSSIQENPDVKIGWDSDNAQIKYKISGPPNPARDEYVKFLKTNVDRINFSFSKLTNIAKAEGTDPNALILGWMKELGVDTGKLPGIPETLRNEIIRANQDPAKQGEELRKRFQAPGETARPPANTAPRGGITDRALPFNETNAPSSGALPTTLGEFLSNPVGGYRPTPQNAPAASTTPTRGIPARRNLNLTDQNMDFDNMMVTDVPPGADLNAELRRGRK
jgi:hypothetical protein